MKNKVYGLVGIKSIMANFNADFTGRPRSTASGKLFASDKALKYCDRKFWENEGESVFAYRSLNENLNPRTLKERYESMFTELKKSKDICEVLNNLFSCIDIANFGIAFAEAGFNLSVNGAVQIGQGINLYDDVNIETLDILSPYRNPKKGKNGEEKNQTTIGEMIIADEAHYFHPFSINPENYNEFKNVKGFKGYTVEHYKKLKEAFRLAATAFNSCTRKGVDNELALFIEAKEDSKVYIPNLTEYVKFDKDDEKGYVIDLRDMDFINSFEKDIDKVEIYYNPYDTVIKENFIKKKTKKFNIFTCQEI